MFKFLDALATIIILPLAFYGLARLAIWAWEVEGSFMYGVTITALLWALIAGASRVGGRR